MVGRAFFSISWREPRARSDAPEESAFARARTAVRDSFTAALQTVLQTRSGRSDSLNMRPTPSCLPTDRGLRRRRTPQAEPRAPLNGSVHELAELCVRPVAKGTEATLWREYDYLGYTPAAGRPTALSGVERAAGGGGLGLGAAAWKVAPRDRFIGWNAAQRAACLHLVVNNARFLILPWVHLGNLASSVLARISKRLPQDWQQRYGYRPPLLETFVQFDRFVGTRPRQASGGSLPAVGGAS